MHILFEWDPDKDAVNQEKHGVSFAEAQCAFADPRRIVRFDEAHSETEPRFQCHGVVDGQVLTVRFTWRGERIRIIGAGYWRGGRKTYEKENPLYRRPR